MTRKELLIELAYCPEVKSQKSAAAFLDSLESIITTVLTAGNSVTISKTFGAFKPVVRAARKGLNLQTREPIDIAASKSVKFSLSAALKRALN